MTICLPDFVNGAKILPDLINHFQTIIMNLYRIMHFMIAISPYVKSVTNLYIIEFFSIYATYHFYYSIENISIII